MGEDRWNEEEVRRPSLFSDEPLLDGESDAVTTERPRGRETPDPDSAEVARQRLRFDDSGSLPAWTEPPTGEVDRTRRVAFHEDPPLDEGVDVWASFTGENPIWGEDAVVEDFTPTGGIDRPIAPAAARTEARASSPGRITIGTDPSGITRRVPPAAQRRQPPAGPSQLGSSSGRDLPMAVAVGLLMAAVFTATVMWRPLATLVFVMALLGLAAVEFYNKVAEKGYRPSVVPGLLAAILAPAAAYWVGPAGLVLVLTFALLVTAGGFIGAESVEAGPLPNTSITMLGVVWIGMLGSFAALILGLSNNGLASTYGTDTLFLLALGVVANDVGAYFVGSAAGRSPLRKWISPAKSVEGFIGGALFTVVVLVIVGISERSTTWTSTIHLVALALVISVMAPMGDLVESMFKRNLDTKDFGTAIKGHGGALDRFDGFLFALPAVYYLTVVLQPWAV
jgi:phosphatidate cytidylyltransferase